MTLRKTFEGDFKKMELTWGTAESEAKDHYGEKEMTPLSPTDRGNKRREQQHSCRQKVVHENEIQNTSSIYSNEILATLPTI